MWVTICGGLVIAALLVWSVKRLIQRRKQGGCASCPYASDNCAGCSKQT